MRPGITDLASIEFRREAELLATAIDPERAYVEQVLPEKLRLASLYVDTVSFWGDLRLILRTLTALMTDPPARADGHRELR